MPKKLLAAVLAAVMCVSLSGCAQKNSEINESNIESKLESRFGGETQSSSKPAPASTPETSEPDGEPLEMFDEIKNADLSSGKIQIFNDIFEPFGKMTVDEFIKKHQEKFDITYKDGTYEERKDYLLEYDWSNENNYHLTLKPKSPNVISDNLASAQQSFSVRIANLTSEDKKIPLGECYVTSVVFKNPPLAYENYTFNAPHVIPGGFTSSTFDAVMKSYNEDYEKPYSGYTADDIREYLVSNGFVELDYGSVAAMAPKSTDYKCFFEFKDSNPQFSVRVCAPKAADGTIPQVGYTFFINEDTDKMTTVRLTDVRYYTEEKIAANAQTSN